jgi:hypothetical protein
MEQTARALNVVCRLWQKRRREHSSELDHVASVIRHHQARNQAAKQSRLRPVRKDVAL